MTRLGTGLTISEETEAKQSSESSKVPFATKRELETALMNHFVPIVGCAVYEKAHSLVQYNKVPYLKVVLTGLGRYLYLFGR